MRARGKSQVFCRVVVLVILLPIFGCSAQYYRRDADRVAADIIKKEQRKALGRTEPFTIETPADTLRRRLIVAQGLPYAGPESLGSDQLKPIKHWPEKGYPPRNVTINTGSLGESGVLKLSLMDALQVAARNSRDYQNRKEAIFQSALRLDLESHAFQSTFAGLLASDYTLSKSSDPRTEGLDNTGTLSWQKQFESGVHLTSRLAVDLVKLLTGDRSDSLGIVADATIAVPLMRGAGDYIVAEPMVQAERDVIYEMWSFERFKLTLAVSVASDYLSVLQRLDEIKNAEDNYRSLIDSGRRARRMADAGRLPEFEVDQARQQELTARDRWITAQQAYARALDQFRVSLGLPTDANVELDRGELDRLAQAAAETLGKVVAPPAPVPPGEAPAPVQPGEATTPAQQGEALAPVQPGEAAPAPLEEPGAAQPGEAEAQAKIELIPLGREGGGPLEMSYEEAIVIAFARRLDLRTALGQVYDAQRGVVVAGNGLLPGLDVAGSGNWGEGRSLGSASEPNAKLDLDRGRYAASADLDLPFDRTSERNSYRNSYIALERSIRSVQALEDQIKLEIRGALRNLALARESYRIQTEAVRLAEKRVRSSELFMLAGRAQIRDVLDAKEALVQAQDDVTGALVNYRIAELELQRDMSVLEVNEKGLWVEYRPDAENKK